jgi:MFS family permease
MISTAAMPYLLAGLWGFLGSFAYATFRARMVLCSGERDPTKQERKRAWGEYLSAPPVGAILGAGLSQAVLHFAPWLNPVGAAAVIGLLANPIMPTIVATFSDGSFVEGLIKRVGGMFSELGDYLSKHKGNEP